MGRRRKRKIVRWHLLWRTEGRQRVWVYEPLTFDQLNRRMREGWRVITMD